MVEVGAGRKEIKGAYKIKGKVKMTTKREKIIFAFLAIPLFCSIVINLWMYNTLQGQNIFLQQTNEQLENQIQELQLPQLHIINLRWIVAVPAKGMPTPSEGRIRVNGTIFNSGSDAAFNIVVRFSVYIGQNMVMGNVRNTELNIEFIIGKAYVNFEHEIYYDVAVDIYDVKATV